MSDSNSGKHFVRINGKVLGPFEMEQLRSLKDRGRLLAEHEISADRRQWEAVGRVAALFAQPEVQTVPVSSSASSNVGSEETEAPGVGKEWFYTVDGEQLGPVSTKKLRKLITNGKLRSDDLVWRDGMSEWHPAEKQEELVDFVFKRSPRQEGKVYSSLKSNTGGQTVLWDIVLGAIRDSISIEALESLYRLVVQIGGISMTISAIAWATFVLLVGIKQDSLQWCLWGLIGVAAISTLKYVAVQLCFAADELIKSTPNTLSSSRFTSTIAATRLLIALTLASVGFFYALKYSDGLVHWNSLDERWFIVAFAIIFPMSALFSALAALHPEWMNISICPNSRAGNEGIAIRAFRLKLSARFAAAGFGTASILGTTATLWAVVLIIRGEDFLLRGIGCGIFGLTISVIGAILPCLAYFWFTRMFVNLDVKQAILSIANQSKPLPGN